MARNNRIFIGRAVRYAAGQDIDQYVDLGCGLVPPPMVDDMARAIHPDAAVAYIDNDAEATDETSRHLKDREGLAVICADLRDAEAVLADPVLRKVINTSEPCCIILGLVLHHLNATQARDVIAGYVRLIAPGSCIVVTTPRFDDPQLFDQLRDACTPASLHNHTRATVASFFDGLELIRPGVRSAAGFRPGWGDAPEVPEPAYVIGAIGRKPPR